MNADTPPAALVRAGFPAATLTQPGSCGVSGFVPGFDPLSAAEGQGLAGMVCLALDRLEQEPVMIPQVVLLEHTAGEPVPKLGQHRRTAGPRPPLAALELVHIVSRLPAEQERQLLRRLRHEMHEQDVGANRDA